MELLRTATRQFFAETYIQLVSSRLTQANSSSRSTNSPGMHWGWTWGLQCDRKRFRPGKHASQGSDQKKTKTFRGLQSLLINPITLLPWAKMATVLFAHFRKNACASRKCKKNKKASGTQGCSRTVPQFCTDRALRRLTSEFGRDPVYSSRYGR